MDQPTSANPVDASSAPERKILVVDDEAPIRNLLTNLLKKLPGAKIASADDGVAGLAWLKERGGDCDLVVSDMQMPRMNGEEMISAIRAEWPKLPIIVLTAHKSDVRVVRCLEMGAMEYLLKPISVDKLMQTVRRVFDRQQRYQGEAGEIKVTSGAQGWVELTAPTDFEYVERFQKFTSLLGTIPLATDAKEDLRVAFDELGQNAVEWGNRYDRGKRIHLSYCLFQDRIVFKIEDEGEGFDPAALNDPSVDPLQHIMDRMKGGKRAGGYGVFLTRKMMDDVMYSERGNMVLLTKFFRKDA